jgi:hypothetical protein
MASPKSVGRITGILLLVHLAGGLMLPYILIQPVMTAPGFLENAAANAVRIRAAVLLLFMSGAITVAVALTALPVFRRDCCAGRHWCTTDPVSSNPVLCA